MYKEKGYICYILNPNPMKKFACLLLMGVILLISCKKKNSEIVDPDHIQQELWYIYYADNNDSYFGVRFYDTDWYTRVILASPSYITLNGYNMNLNTVNSFYESHYDNEQVPTGTFVYSDQWKRVYTNTANLERQIELPAIDTLFKNKDNVITWQGAPCGGGNESVTIHVGIILPVAEVTTNQAGATSVTIKAGALSVWNSGVPIRIRIDRQTTFPLQQGTGAGGKIITRYESVVKKVMVQ
jgi:hypothetical protein